MFWCRDWCAVRRMRVRTSFDSSPRFRLRSAESRVESRAVGGGVGAGADAARRSSSERAPERVSARSCDFLRACQAFQSGQGIQLAEQSTYRAREPVDGCRCAPARRTRPSCARVARSPRPATRADIPVLRRRPQVPSWICRQPIDTMPPCSSIIIVSDALPLLPACLPGRLSLSTRGTMRERESES